jgi:hypothetical protein
MGLKIQALIQTHWMFCWRIRTLVPLTFPGEMPNILGGLLWMLQNENGVREWAPFSLRGGQDNYWFTGILMIFF